MKIYGQTQDIIVREMVKSDCEKFLEMMTEHGTNEDLTVWDVENLWEMRKRRKYIQCTVTSIDGSVIYGFCGVVHGKLCVALLRNYLQYEEQTEKITEKLYISYHEALK